ncbi:Hypothetical predicted protein [Olea europaea subsp. europaea]|uniref:Uncharacterized protein n=1 Tax=Olea europaea subsp. europaea TaxID=158383 RepID=A0A8S0V4P0_OLEEU|nr:Hypothetical predicted protein [Olea europaea subsp. europaea]
MEMLNNHGREGSSPRDDGDKDEFFPVGPAEVVAESDDDSVDRGDPTNGTALYSPNDSSAAEDGGREDMFVDCPDEMETSEILQSFEDEDDIQNTQFEESDNGINVRNLMDEIEQLRGMLAEKDRFAQEYKEERAAFTRELAHLCHQVKALNVQQSLLGENGVGLGDHLHQMDIGVLEEYNLVSSTSLHETISQCLMFFRNALNEHSQTEDKIRELHSTLHMKDQEIEILNAKVAEYKRFLSETNQLRGCLAEIISDINVEDETEIIVIARNKLLELKRNEEYLYQNLMNLKVENRKLVEHIDEQKLTVNAEIGRLGELVEQEKMKCANTKEKLNLAVTKGKSLVQHRDSLKQLLAEKTSQLENCLIELQEKSSALVAAEQCKDLLASSENLAASLRESLVQKDTIIQKCGEILSGADVTEELQSIDFVEKFKCLVDERKTLKAMSLEYHKLKDTLSLFDFPETVLSSELDARIRWLLDSLYLSKEEAVKLQHEIAETKESASSEIDCLITSLAAVTQEKSNLQAELEDLRNKNETLEKLQHEAIEAKEAANIEIDSLTRSLLVETEAKNYLHVELENLRQKLEGVIQKEYRVSLEKDQMVSMLMEAFGITREDQEEVCKEQFDGTIIIDKCLTKMKEEFSRLESSQVGEEVFENIRTLLYIRDQELTLYELVVGEDVLDRTKLDLLLNELETVTQECNALKNEKVVLQENLELLEGKSSLIREKLSMAVKKGKGLVQERENLKGALDEKINEIDKLKSELQQKLFTLDECHDKISILSLDVERIPKLEADLVAMNEHRDEIERLLSESNSVLQRLMESIDGIIPPANLAFEEHVGKVKWLAGYLSECENSKMEVEQELRKVKEEASVLVNKLLESQMTTKSLDDVLSEAKNNISLLLEEKKELEVAKTYVEDELKKATEEAYSQTLKLEEVSANRRSVEDALLIAENNISKLMNEKDVAVQRSALAEEELQKLKEEFSVYSSMLVGADKTIQSLEDALSEAKMNVAFLADENNKVQMGRIQLDSEMKKLKDKADSQASKLVDASLTIKSLKEALLSSENKLAKLVNEKKSVEQEMLALNSKLNVCMQELAGIHGSTEIRSLELSSQLSLLQSVLKDETLISLQQQCFEKKSESLKDIDLLLKEMKDCFLEINSDVPQNSFVVEDDSSISNILPSSFDNICNVEVVNGEVNATDGDNMLLHIGKMVEGFHLKDKIIADKFKNLSAFTDESNSTLLRKLYITKDRMISMLELIKSLKQRVKDEETDKQRLENTILSLESSMQNKFEEMKRTCDRVVKERDLYKDRIIQLEADLEVQENVFNETRLKQQDCEAEVDKLKRREAELSSLYAASLSKVQEMEDCFLTVPQMKILFDKINEIEVSDAAFAAGGVEPHDSFDVRKLFYIIDNFDKSQQMVSSLFLEKEELQSTLDKQVFEIEHLNNKVKEHIINEKDSERMKNELLELESGLQNIFMKLGDNELIDDHKVTGAIWLVPLLDNLVMALVLKSENLKSKIDELDAKFHGSQMLVSDLSNKVKLLQDSNRARISPSEDGQDRGTSEASLPTMSEISEIQDTGSLGKSYNISPVSSAAHVRTMRMSPSDNVSIDIDSESERLVNNEEADDDKGHIFKSLNTSGLIPRNGKTVADRIDGIWVSGSRALMGRPRARLGVIAYCLFLHIWLLGTIL